MSRADRWPYTGIELWSIGIDGEGGWIESERLRWTESEQGRSEANQLDENRGRNDTDVGDHRRAKGGDEAHRHEQLHLIETVLQRSRRKKQFAACHRRVQMDRRCAGRVTRPNRPFDVHGQRRWRTVQFDQRHDGKGFAATERSSDSRRRTRRAQSEDRRRTAYAEDAASLFFSLSSTNALTVGRRWSCCHSRRCEAARLRGSAGGEWQRRLRTWR